MRLLLGNSGNRKFSNRQNSGHNFSPTEEPKIGVRVSALPSTLWGYQSSSSILLGSEDFGLFPGSPSRGLLGLPATTCPGHWAVSSSSRRPSMRIRGFNSNHTLGSLASQDVSGAVPTIQGRNMVFRTVQLEDRVASRF